MSEPASEATTAWHTLGVDSVLAALSSTRTGLSKSEVAERLAREGPNELQAAAHVSP